MTRVLRAGFWLGVALAIHLAMVWQFGSGVQGGGGTGGDAIDQLTGAPPALAVLVTEWEDAPDPAAAPAPAAPIAPPEAAPTLTPLPAPAERGAAPDLAAPAQTPAASVALPDSVPDLPDPTLPLPAPEPAATDDPLPEPATEPATEPTAAPARPAAMAMPVPTPEPAPAPDPPARQSAPDDTARLDPAPQVRPRARPPVLPGMSRAAAGTGGGEVMGNSVTDTLVIGEGIEQVLLAAWHAKIRNSIARQQPPFSSSGVVHIQFVVGWDGRLISSRVRLSSGDRALDRAAINALRRAAPFPPAPVSLPYREYPISLPVTFRR